MKYLLAAVLLLSGCHPKQACDFHSSPPDSLKLCEAYCNSYGEDFSQVLQMSYGTCICENSEGQKVAEGYHRLLNNKDPWGAMNKCLEHKEGPKHTQGLTMNDFFLCYQHAVKVEQGQSK